MPHNHRHFENLKVETLPEGEAQVTGEITLPFLVECRPEALKALNERSNIAGFRPGHIPEPVLVKQLGEMRVLEEVAEVALGRAYGHIIEELKLTPIGRPSVAITKLAPSIPLEFKITVTLEPTFDLPDYKKIAKETPKDAVKDDAKEDEKFWAREKHRAAVVEALIKATDIKLPKMLVEGELERMLGQFKADIEKRGPTGKAGWDEYLKSIKKTEAEVREEWRERAVGRVKSEMIIVKIAEKEKIEPTLEELEHEAKHLMEHYPEADPLRLRLYVFQLLRNTKVLEFLENIDKINK